jgi:hopanoid-associated phosphorylase
MRAEARIARRLGVVGIGAERAEALAAGLGVAGTGVLISFGLAGGLDPALPPGTLIVAEAVVTLAGERFAAAPALITALITPLITPLGGATAGTILASPGIVGESAEKARLFAATGAVAVDMESGAVARAAARHGIPFAVLRAIGDPAGRDLPAAAKAAFGAGGGVAVWPLLASLAADPGQIPALIALARETRLAMRGLRDAARRLTR